MEMPPMRNGLRTRSAGLVAMTGLVACFSLCLPGSVSAQHLDPRYTLRFDMGESVGYDTGFTYLQGWHPLLQQPGYDVWFSDVRVTNYNDVDFWEWNVGGGHR